MSARYEGEVYYNHDEILHIKSFQNKNGTPCKQDERTRFAYLVVSKDEARQLAGSLKDNKAVVDAAKAKYAAILKQAIEAEDANYVQVNKNIRNVNLKQENKLVHLFNAPAYNVTSKANALKSKSFKDAAKNLEKSEAISGEKINVTYLHKDKKECDAYINEENRAFSRTNVNQAQQEAYALVSLPYVYNYILKNSKEIVDIDFRLSLYENEVSVSLMPKLQVEFGVFFDGTNNNMYNIDFFQDFKKYVKKQIDFIREIKKTSDNENEDLFAKAFLEHPSEKNETIMNLLRNEVIADMRYFEERSLVGTKNKYHIYSDSATKDSDKLFLLFVEVYQTHNGIEDGFFEGIGDYFNNLSGLDRGTLVDEKKLDAFIGEYLVKEVLPDSVEDSSYTNGYTNIKRLYEHYEGADRLSRTKADIQNVKSYKLYASGSGTIDPVDNMALDNDSLFGLGLGTGKAGVKAHIIYSCEKIAEQLREQKTTHVDELVLDVFGFSRGATEARHFACTLMKDFALLKQDGYLEYALDTDEEGKNAFSPFYEEENGLYTYINDQPYFNPLIKGAAGAYRKGEEDKEDAEMVINEKYHDKPEISIKSLAFRHANIGDTVTHYGFMQSNDSKDLNIHFDKEKIGSVYHIMAMDEYRYNFEAHSIFDAPYSGVHKVEGNFKEFIVPGAHADVGGGYQNSPAEELILYPVGTDLDKLKTWNKRYQWIAKDYYDDFEVSSIGEKAKEGGYLVKKENHTSHRHG